MESMNYAILTGGIRPIGRGFHPQEKCEILGSKASTASLRETIDEHRADLQARILDNPQYRTDRDEAKFICKAALICGSISGVKRNFLEDKDLLISILCDRDILCSMQYQGYASTHREYLPVRQRHIGEHDMAAYIEMPNERQEAYQKLAAALKDEAVNQAKKEGKKYITVLSVLNHFQAEMTFAYANDDEEHTSYKSVIESILGENNKAAGQLASLGEDECRFFSETVFPQYVKHASEEESIKNAAAQFRRKYYKWQYEYLKEGTELRTRIEKLWSLAQKQYLPDIKAVLADIAGDLMGGANECLLTDLSSYGGAWSEELLAAADDYVYVMNGRRSTAEYTSTYLSSLMSEANLYLHPLMALCTLSDMRYACRFREEVTTDGLINMLLKLHKANAEQRVAAMRFLKAILCELAVDAQYRKEAWEMLSVVLGHAIASHEEREAWEKICGTDCSGDSGLPLIRLDFLLQEAANACITEQPESLYSYRLGSPLQLGKYAQFLQERPEAVNKTVGRILKNKKRWEAKRSEYWKMWYSDDTSRADAAAVCAEASNLIRWASIFDGYDLSVLCKVKENDDDQGKSKEEKRKEREHRERKYKETEKELKALLTEHAFRKILNDEARGVLKEAARELLDKQFGL